MLRTLFIGGLLIPWLFRALRNRFDALTLYLWFAFFRPLDWLWIDTSALRASLVLGLVLIVPAPFSGVWPNLSHPLSIGSVLFLLTALLAHTNAVNPEMSYEWIDFQARL